MLKNILGIINAINSRGNEAKLSIQNLPYKYYKAMFLVLIFKSPFSYLVGVKNVKNISKKKKKSIK